MKLGKIVNSLTQTADNNEYIKSRIDEFEFIDDEKIQQLQNCYLKMLKDLNGFCAENCISYALTAGSLLGKVRHNGFIPWDDDFDIVMSRKDAEKLKSVFAKSCLADAYDLRGPGCKEGAEVRILKIYKKDSTWIPAFYKKNAMNKVFIDIFVLDYLPSNLISRCLRGITSDLLVFIIGCVEYKVNGINTKDRVNGAKGVLHHVSRNVIGTVFSIIPLNMLYNWFDAVGNYKKETKQLTQPTGKMMYFGEIIPTEVFYPFQKSELCGVETWIPNKPLEYLSHRYGDYMCIPDENERELHYVRKMDVGKI